ncbi:uncharacterized protein Pyn_13423 [Prunus yedoensis var. nudiflora]|uniref:Uncharacterized protein n=1 Tax=Prunus yedoensis var. nudiflora TaxID=2094558 RepID=A0A314ZGG0_PRUYE|nr:uncharacterized protein Pyn_13423 [Prunus yedoensis var. nudiflora]
MKLIWSPENATKAYMDTVRSSLAAWWNAEFIVETWSQGGVTATSIGLEIASCHTCCLHVCVVPAEQSIAEFVTPMKKAGMTPEVLVGEPEEMMAGLVGIDFLVVDSKLKDFARVLRQARLSPRGAVLCARMPIQEVLLVSDGEVWIVGQDVSTSLRSPNRKIKTKKLDQDVLTHNPEHFSI